MATLFVKRREGDVAGFMAAHIQEKAEALIQLLQIGPATSQELVPLRSALLPDGKCFALGAYESGFILCDERLFSFVDNDKAALRKTILESFPTSKILCVLASSGTNLWGFASFANGKLQRAAAGSGDVARIVDIGDVQPEEHKYWSQKHLAVSDVPVPSDYFPGFRSGQSLVTYLASEFCEQELFDWTKPSPQFPKVQLFSRL